MLLLKLNNAGAAGATVRLVLDLSALDLADGGEELDEVVVAGGPRKLEQSVASTTNSQGRTYVSDVDGLARLAAARGIVGEGVRRVGCSAAGIKSAAGNESRCTTTEASATAKAAKGTAATTEASTAAETAAKASATAKTATATEPTGTCEPVLAHLEVAALPLIAIELLNGIASVVGGLEGDNAGALRPAIGCDVHIGTHDLAVDRCLNMVVSCAV